MKRFLQTIRDSFRVATTPARARRLAVEALDDRALPSGLVGLGAAGTFGVLAINGGDLTLNSSHLVGDVGLGPNGTSVLQKTDVTGTFFADPSAQVDLSNYGGDFTVTGGVVTQSLGQAEADANAASAAYAALAPTQSFGSVTKSITVSGNGGTNVIAVGSVAYNSKTLTLSGGTDDVFVFNVSGGFNFADSRIVLTGGVTASHVVFNFPTAGPTIKLSKSTNVVSATFLAPERDVIYHNPAGFTGAIVAHNIDIHSNANLTASPFSPPDSSPPASLSGTVYFDDIRNGVHDPEEAGVGDVTLQLTGFDAQGNPVTRTTQTDADGHYSFANLPAGTYQIFEVQPDVFEDGDETVGTVNGSVRGSLLDNDLIGSITIGSGENGIGYDFGEVNERPN